MCWEYTGSWRRTASRRKGGISSRARARRDSAPSPLSRDRLLNEVWGYSYYGTTRTLDQVIVQLRKKLGDSGSEPKYLLTVHGVGYKLEPGAGE